MHGRDSVALARRYGVAAASMVAAVALRLLVGPVLGSRFPFATLFVAVLVAAAYGGFGPALLATMIGAVASAWLLLPPEHGFADDAAVNLAGLILYVAVSLGMAGIGGALRRARRRAEITLRQAASERERLRVTLQSIGDGVIVTDAAGRVTSLNPVAEELTGRRLQDVLGRPLDEIFRIVHEHTGEPAENPVTRVLAEGRVVGLANHTLLVAADGTRRPIDDSAAPIRNDTGDVIGVVLVFRDVTERRHAEERRALLAAAVQSSEDAIVTKTLEGAITSWNRGAERLYGYSAAEAVGQPITIIVPADRLDEERMILDRLRRGERIEHFETVRVSKSGRLLDISLSISPVHDAEGRIVGVSKVARDVTAKKQADARLRTLAAVVEQSSDFIGVCTPDMVPIYVNEAGRRMVGLDSMDEVRRTAVLDFFWPEDRPFVEREAVPALLRDGRWRGEVRFRHFKTNRPIHTMWNATVIRDEAGEPAAWATVSPNLDALKETERALQESRAQLAEEAAALHALHEISSRMMATTELPAALDEILGASIALLGADMGHVQLLDESRGTLEIVAHRGFDPRFLDHFRTVAADDAAPCGRAIRDGKRVVVEDVERDEAFAPHRAAAAEVGYRALQSTPLCGPGGPALGVLSTHFRAPQRPAEGRLRLLDLYARLAAELIERVRSEATLRESEERFRTLADNISQFAWMADAKGWIFWYNRRWFEYTGTTLDEVQGWGWTKLHHPDHVDRVVSRIQHSWDTGEVWEDTFPLRGRDGTYRWFLSRATPIRDAAGRVLRWFGTNTDITEQREAEEALRQADRRKDEFLATLAHELRNPLAPVRNSLEIMKRAKDDPALVEHALATVDRQMAHLERLVDDLLDVSRITRDKLELRRAHVDLRSVVRQAVETCRPLAERVGHELTITLPEEPVRLHADPVRLAQVLSNLLSNACKYTEPGGRIQLTARRLGDELEISVKDTGLGIAGDVLPRVFDMFVQGPGAAERMHGGLGIGLTLVRRLVEMHGGSIEAHSDGPNRGSEFVVRLSVLRDAEEAEAAASPAIEPPAVRRRILVVDDNLDAADSLATLLSIFGHETHLAHDGRTAIAAAAALRPDVVLLDIGLPNLSGHDAARMIREQPWGKGMVLVALTGWGQDDDRRKSMEFGFDHHLVKPVDIDTLTTLLSSIPASPRAEAAD